MGTRIRSTCMLLACAGSMGTAVAAPCEDPGKVGIEQPLVDGTRSAIVWNGTEYGMVWTRPSSPRTDLWFARFDASGLRLGSEVRITTNGLSERPAIVWTGDGWGVAWRRNRSFPSIDFVLLDREGHRRGVAVEIAPPAEDHWAGPQLAWTGDDIGVAWNLGLDVHLTRLDSAGQILDDTVVGDSLGLMQSVVWDGTRYAFLTYAGSKFWFFRTDVDAKPVGFPRLVGEANGAATIVSDRRRGQLVAWDSGYAMVLHLCPSPGDCTVAFRRVNILGTPLGLTALDQGFARNPSLAWNGTEFGVAWYGEGPGPRFVRMDSAGTAHGPALAVTLGDSWNGGPNIVWNGAEYGIFVEPSYGNAADTIWLARIACDCRDADGDGFTLCAGDCDDQDPGRFPGAPEICNRLDDDCDGIRDEGDPTQDDDRDGADDLCDNCLSFYNPAQTDRDDDGEGDSCDTDDGWIVTRFDEPDVVVWDLESGFTSWNVYRGDLATLVAGGDYTQSPETHSLADRFCGLAEHQLADAPSVSPGAVAFYLVTGGAGDVEGDLGADGSGALRLNAHPCP